MKISELCLMLKTSKNTVRKMIKYGIVTKKGHDFLLVEKTKEEILKIIIDIEGEKYIKNFVNSGIYKIYFKEETIENLYNIYSGIYAPKCNNIKCNNKVKFKGLGATTPNRYTDKYCSTLCANSCTAKIKKTENNNLKKYGKKNISSLKEIQLKREKTLIRKYGDKSYNNICKIKKTMIERYGKHYMSTEEFKIKRDNTWNIKYGGQFLKSNQYLKLYNGRFSSTNKFRKIMEEKRNWIPLEKISDFKLYKLKVWQYTNKQDLKSLDNYEKRGRVDINDKCYHLDHIISISEGFFKNIPVYIIGNIDNLQMLYWRDNIIKSNKFAIPDGQ